MSATIYLLDSKVTIADGPDAITLDDLRTMADAVGAGVAHFERDWGLRQDERVFVKQDFMMPQNPSPDFISGIVIASIVDDLIDPDTQQVVTDALAWHYIDDKGIRHVDIGYNAIRSVGGGKFVGSDKTPYVSLTQAMSHEFNEDTGDPFTNGWSLRDGTTLVANEVCDAVESDGYFVNARKGGKKGTSQQVVKCALSSYVLKAWFDPFAPEGTRLDRMGSATTPLRVAPGGYLITIPTDGSTNQEDGQQADAVDGAPDAAPTTPSTSGYRIEWGDAVPEWRKQLRRPRMAKRLEHARKLAQIVGVG